MKNKIFAFLVLVTVTINAQTTFSTDSKDARNQATFVSDAPLEKIVGLTGGLDAAVVLNKEDITKNPKGIVKVPIKEINTGIDLRNEHIRSEMWLNAGKYPFAEFELSGIKNPSSNSLSDGNKIKATANGNFTVHGVTKNVSVPVEITYLKENEKTKTKMPGNLIRITGEFSIKLSDYNIKIPDMVVGRVDENVKVTVDFVASDTNDMASDDPCNPCKPKENPCKPNK